MNQLIAMLLPRFSPPARVADLSSEGQKRWSDDVSKMIDKAIAGSGNQKDSPRPQFFNPTKTQIAADRTEKGVFWTATPRTLLFETAAVRKRWEIADGSRDRQDEYCEWAVARDGNGKVTRVTFTSEVPEYFKALAEDDEEKLLKLYRELIGPQVQRGDLFEINGSYKGRNKWNDNTKIGPVHLVQGSNNLGAAVELAAAATIVRVITGTAISAEQELILCSKYGEPRRNSDPHIGAQINALARAKADVTLADPIGLYINDFTPAGFTTPDGTKAKDFWRFTRGEKGHWVRGVFEVPATKSYIIGDIKIRGVPIEFGAQVADFVSVKIIGLACRIGGSNVPAHTSCA